MPGFPQRGNGGIGASSDLGHRMRLRKYRRIAKPDQSAIKFIGDMQRLELKPDDVLVVRCPGTVSLDTAERLRDMLESQFPGHKAVVLEDGLELGVLSPNAETEG